MENWITIESFGAEVPENWETIAALLNQLIEERGMADNHEAVNELWEAYWNNKVEFVLNRSGAMIYYDAAVGLMDDEIREALHAEGYEDQQSFFTAYEKAHEAKYGEEWFLSGANPVW